MLTTQSVYFARTIFYMTHKVCNGTCAIQPNFSFTMNILSTNSSIQTNYLFKVIQRFRSVFLFICAKWSVINVVFFLSSSLSLYSIINFFFSWMCCICHSTCYWILSWYCIGIRHDLQARIFTNSTTNYVIFYTNQIQSIHMNTHILQ